MQVQLQFLAYLFHSADVVTFLEPNIPFGPVDTCPSFTIPIQDFHLALLPYISLKPTIYKQLFSQLDLTQHWRLSKYISPKRRYPPTKLPERHCKSRPLWKPKLYTYICLCCLLVWKDTWTEILVETAGKKCQFRIGCRSSARPNANIDARRNNQRDAQFCYNQFYSTIFVSSTCFERI